VLSPIPTLFNGRLAYLKHAQEKIMRRILRKVAANELDNLGDISTLADPAVVDDIIKHRANK
jgi:acetyl-CoA synthetase